MKIVSLLPSATEIVCALGLRDQLVAVSHECDYPSDVATLPRITSSHLHYDLPTDEIDRAVVDAVLSGQSLYRIDGDMLAELQPDLIVTQGVCDVCAVAQDTVNATLRFVADVISDEVMVLSLSAKNFAGVLRDIEQLAAVVGATPAAEELVQSLHQRWSVIAAKPQPSRASTVMMLEWPDPPFYGGHWVPEQVHVAGGRNALGEQGLDSRRCTWEEIAAADPDYIFVMACGYGLDANLGFAENLRQVEGAKELRAVREGQVWACDANSFFSRPAPRIIEGAEIIQQVLGGETPPAERAKKIK
ncbi:MAG: cobalamin-binding protein [Pseudomonadota bacterium]